MPNPNYMQHIPDCQLVNVYYMWYNVRKGHTKNVLLENHLLIRGVYHVTLFHTIEFRNCYSHILSFRFYYDK